MESHTVWLGMTKGDAMPCPYLKFDLSLENCYDNKTAPFAIGTECNSKNANFIYDFGIVADLFQVVYTARY